MTKVVFCKRLAERMTEKLKDMNMDKKDIEGDDLVSSLEYLLWVIDYSYLDFF